MSDLMQLKPLVPFVYNGVEEIDALIDAEQPLFDKAIGDLRIAFNNTFILRADEDGVKEFEYMLKIHPDPSDDLDIRKLRILNYWVNQLPYTYRALVRKLNIICGVGNYEIEKRFNDYEMTILLIDIPYTIIKDVRNMLRQMIPANIDWLIRWAITWEFITINKIFAGVYVHAKVYTYSQPDCKLLDGTWVLDGSVLLGGIGKDRVPAEMSIEYTFHYSEHMAFYIHRLDGTWELDGNVLLDAIPHTMECEVSAVARTINKVIGEEN